jgi:hypothetical protein
MSGQPCSLSLAFAGVAGQVTQLYTTASISLTVEYGAHIRRWFIRSQILVVLVVYHFSS